MANNASKTKPEVAPVVRLAPETINAIASAVAQALVRPMAVCARLAATDTARSPNPAADMRRAVAEGLDVATYVRAEAS